MSIDQSQLIMHLEVEIMLTTKQQWLWLKDRWQDLSPTITLQENYIQPGVVVTEEFEGNTLFQLTRYFNGKRITDIDRLGFVGVSMTNLSDKSLIITEGVSDFLSLKSEQPTLNVWGKTKLSLSRLQLHIIKSLFTNVILIADNDNTGITKAFDIQSKLKRAGLDTDVFLPQNKDITLDLYQGVCTFTYRK